MIKVENLTKTFGPKVAVNDVSFTVQRGEVLGFLGPNGAGKSTTMRMVTGFLPPTAGRVTIGTHDMLEDPVPAKRLIGYLPENPYFYDHLTAEELLEYFASLFGYPGAERKVRAARLYQGDPISTTLRPRMAVIGELNGEIGKRLRQFHADSERINRFNL